MVSNWPTMLCNCLSPRAVNNTITFYLCNALLLFSQGFRYLRIMSTIYNNIRITLQFSKRPTQYASCNPVLISSSSIKMISMFYIHDCHKRKSLRFLLGGPFIVIRTSSKEAKGQVKSNCSPSSLDCLCNAVKWLPISYKFA